MSPRPRPAFALALATTLAGTTAHLPAAADEPEEPVVLRCFTQALTPQQVEAGATSDVDCVEVSEGAPMARSSTTIAILHDLQDGGGDQLNVLAASCTGATVNFSSSDYWNNRASSTTLVVCGNAKHWSGANFTGSSQLKSGGGFHEITGSMEHATSSIEYA